MSKQLHWKNWLLPLYCRLYILRKNHIQCKVKKAHTPTLSANKCKKKKENKKKTLKMKRIGIQINMTNETKNIYIIMSSIEAFFLSERALPGSKYPSVHIIELACMIQVFRLICFWAKTKWTYVQREKRNLFSTGETPFC